MKHFITGMEFSKRELIEMIVKAKEYKHNELPLPSMEAKILTLIFANPSLRTRLSFESGFKKSGGSVNVLNVQDSWDFEYEDGVTMDQETQEHIKDAIKVVSRYSDVIGIRKCDVIGRTDNPSEIWKDLRKDVSINEASRYSEKPIINMESNMYHPCQAMADILTVFEQFGSIDGVKVAVTWAPHPKPLPLATVHSEVLIPSLLGMDVTLTHPKGFDIDPDVLEMSGNSLKIIHDQEEAFRNADVVIAKSWFSMAGYTSYDDYKDWMITREKMSLTKKGIFLHCLPVRRNVVVSDDVLDSIQSKHIDNAENRMWVQMSIVNKLING